MVSILRQVQDQVASQLSSSEQLSACQILVEDIRDIDFEIKNALRRQGLVLVVTTPKATFAGKLEDQSLAWQLDQLEIDCVENVPVNRGCLSGDFITAQEAAMSVFDVLCPLEGSREGQIHPVSYEQGQDHGLLVSRCILKCLVTGESSGPGPGPEPISMTFVKLLEEAPPEGVLRKDGWMWPADGGFVIWQDGEAHALGVGMDQISAYVDSRLSDYLPLSGGTMNGTIEFSMLPDDEQQAYKLIQLNETGEYWQALFGVDDNNGQPFVAHNGSETGAGQHYEYTWKLWFPDENGTLATREWTQGEISCKADLSGLSKYLPLSGGTLSGDLGLYRRTIKMESYDGTTIRIYPSPGAGLYIGVPDYNDPQKIRQYLFTGTDYSNIDRVVQFGDLSSKADFSDLSSKADVSDLADYLPLSGGDMTGAIGIYPGNDGGIQFGSDKMWWGPGGISLESSQDDYCIFPVGYGSQTGSPNLLAKRGDLSAYPQSNEISATRVETMTTIHESDWADISASASSSTLYIVIPD